MIQYLLVIALLIVLYCFYLYKVWKDKKRLKRYFRDNTDRVKG